MASVQLNTVSPPDALAGVGAVVGPGDALGAHRDAAVVRVRVRRALDLREVARGSGLERLLAVLHRGDPDGEEHADEDEETGDERADRDEAVAAVALGLRLAQRERLGARRLPALGLGLGFVAGHGGPSGQERVVAAGRR